jgi:hypothetical protein
MQKKRFMKIRTAFAVLGIFAFISVVRIGSTSSNKAAAAEATAVDSKWLSFQDAVDFSVEVKKTDWYRIDIVGQVTGSRAATFLLYVNNSPRGEYSLPAAEENQSAQAHGPQYVYLSEGHHTLRFILKTRAGTALIEQLMVEEQTAPPLSKIVGVSQDTGDLIVATLNVRDVQFGAAGDGKTDDTEAIQQALDMAYNMGGGIVFLPSGRYKIDGHLVVPDNIVMRGEWHKPGTENDNSRETILLAYSGRGDAEGQPLIVGGHGSTVIDLSIFYPEQTVDDIQPYPWAIANIDAGGQTQLSVRNVTLYNAYRGINLSRKNGSSQKIDQVYGTVLHEGILIDNVWVIPEFANIKFNNSIWSNSGLENAPRQENERQALLEYTSQNAIGITSRRGGNTFMYNIDIDPDELKIGILLADGDESININTRGTRGLLTNIHETTVKPEFIAKAGLVVADDVVGSNQFSYSFAQERHPDSTTFIDVRQPPYKAVGDGVADDTKAIQKALDMAGRIAGSEPGGKGPSDLKPGGTVFLSPGNYKISGTLNIPAGVELRGAFEAPYNNVNLDSATLLAYHDRGNEEGDPFIRLKENSGIHGVTIRYPEQLIDDIQPYPWTIQADGDRAWVEYVSIVNGYNLINMYDAKCDNCLVKGVFATALNKGIYFGGGSTGEQLESNTITPATWLGSNYPDISNFSLRDMDDEANSKLSDRTGNHTKAFVIGAANRLQAFSNFAFTINEGFNFVEQNGQGCTNCTLFKPGVESGARFGIRFGAGEHIDLVGVAVGGTGHTPGSSGDKMHDVLAEESFTGNATMYGRLNWGKGDDILSDHVRILEPGQGERANGHTNVALGKPVAVDSTKPYEPHRPDLYPASNPTSEGAVDGSRLTGWVSDDEDAPHWLQVDLLQEYTLSSWQVFNSGVAGESPQTITRDAQLQVSGDGTDWQTVDSVEGNVERVIDRSLGQDITARYVRLLITDPVQSGLGSSTAQIQEFRVFGVPADENQPE